MEMTSVKHFLWLIYLFMSSAACLKPYFVRPLENLTVTEGREATFTCSVNHLGGHKVAWIKSDSKAILAIHDVVITHISRLNVQHHHNTWTLTLRNVKRSDSGPYMCQVNTDPMHYQVGTLEVVVPPDIVTSDTSGDVIIPEGGSARLQCKAEGHPPPSISWQREDVALYKGEVLQLHGVTRSEMGIYLCIANNGIPPPVSKRTMLTVNFPPMVEVLGGLIGAHIGDRCVLSCVIESSPRAIFYWSKHNDEMILTGSRHVTAEQQISLYGVNMTLTIVGVTQADLGSYHCVAKNSIGETEGTITVYELKRPSTWGEPATTEATSTLTEEPRVHIGAPQQRQHPAEPRHTTSPPDEQHEAQHEQPQPSAAQRTSTQQHILAACITLTCVRFAM